MKSLNHNDHGNTTISLCRNQCDCYWVFHMLSLTPQDVSDVVMNVTVERLPPVAECDSSSS